MELDTQNIKDILKYGFMGVGTLLSLMSFFMLRTSLSKESPNKNILGLIWTFLIFSTLLILFSFVSQEYNILRPPVTVKVDPTDPTIWNMNKDRERWYNAPYALASDEFIDENTEEIKTNGVKFEFLLFQGETEEDRLDFIKKFKRMRHLVKKMGEKVDLKGKLEVSIHRTKAVPTVSFFNPKKLNGKDAIIYYIQSLIDSDGRPQVAFQTDHPTIVKYFNSRFSEDFEEAEIISIENLLNNDIKDSSFYSPNQ